jgi:hypothetical protein
VPDLLLRVVYGLSSWVSRCLVYKPDRVGDLPELLDERFGELTRVFDADHTTVLLTTCPSTTSSTASKTPLQPMDQRV